MQKFTHIGVALLALCASACIVVVDGHGKWHSSHGDSSEQLRGSGRPATQARETEELRSIVMNCGGEVVVRVGAPRAVRITCDDNLLDHVVTSVDQGVLQIEMKPGHYRFVNELHVEVDVPELDRFVLAGSGKVELHGLNGGSLELDLDGSGRFVAHGTVERLDADIRGAGHMELFELRARSAKVGLSGAGGLRVNVTDELDATLSGSGEVRYRGTPATLRKNVTGAGSIERD